MTLAIIGGGPAGLMAAEAALAGGVAVEVFDGMATVGRKFLLAGRGGLNLTHAEPFDAFLARYGARRAALEPLLAAFGPDELRAWAAGLGIDTFVGSSGRVFPAGMFAAPLLRAWLRRLRGAGAAFAMRHRWRGWDPGGALRFDTPQGERRVPAAGVVLALGGGSWPELGSDGSWVPLLAARGIGLAPLRPSNCGFDVGWSEHLRTRWAGQPVKPVGATFTDAQGRTSRLRGECVLTETGLQGGVIYALSAALRDVIEAQGSALLQLDLAPDRDEAALRDALAQPRAKRTLTARLQRRAGITGAKAALLRECVSPEVLAEPARLAEAIKALPVRLRAPRPLAEAISTAGGVTFEALDDRLMLRALPGVFCAGEMLDWEAPTGGYLLTACFASGRAAGIGAAAWLAERAAR